MTLATAITIDPEFRALIPPLSEDERRQLEENRLGFIGWRDRRDATECLRLMPTPMGSLFWIWSHMSSAGIETFAKKPTAVSRLPISEWRGYRFDPHGMSPIWDYPPPESSAASSAEGADVYFIQAVNGGPIKIGIAVDVESRLETFQCGSPVPLRIVGVIRGAGISTEQRLHRRFAAHRLHGEWFEPAAALLDFIATGGQR